MKKIIFIVGAAMLLAFNSCTISYPGFATSNSVGSKVGVAERTIFFGISFGHTDLGIATAANKGGITKIATVDTSVTGGLFKTTYRTIVTGE